MSHSNFVADKEGKEENAAGALVDTLASGLSLFAATTSPILAAAIGAGLVGFSLLKRQRDEKGLNDAALPTPQIIEESAKEFTIDKTPSRSKVESSLAPTQVEDSALPLDPETQAKVNAVKKAVSELPLEGLLEIISFAGAQFSSAQSGASDLMFRFPELFYLQRSAEQFISAVVGVSDRKQLCLADIAARDLMVSIAEISKGRCEFSRGLDINGKDIPAFRGVTKFPELIAFELAIKRFKPEFEKALKTETAQDIHRAAANLARGVFDILQAQMRFAFEVEDSTATVSFGISGQTPFARWNDKTLGESKTTGLGGKSGRPPEICR